LHSELIRSIDCCNFVAKISFLIICILDFKWQLFVFQYILLATKILHFIGEHFLHSPNSEVRSCIRYGS